MDSSVFYIGVLWKQQLIAYILKVALWMKSASRHTSQLIRVGTQPKWISALLICLKIVSKTETHVKVGIKICTWLSSLLYVIIIEEILLFFPHFNFYFYHWSYYGHLANECLSLNNAPCIFIQWVCEHIKVACTNEETGLFPSLYMSNDTFQIAVRK